MQSNELSNSSSDCDFQGSHSFIRAVMNCSDNDHDLQVSSVEMADMNQSRTYPEKVVNELDHLVHRERFLGKVGQEATRKRRRGGGELRVDGLLRARAEGELKVRSELTS